jgi:hypothetical protein
MNEENGLRGGKIRGVILVKGESYFALVSDSGGFSPRFFS